MIVALRLLLVLAYLGLAGLAGARQSPLLAAIALGDLAILILLDPLSRRRLTAWGGLLVIMVGLWWLSRTRFALLPLLLVPPTISAWVGWWFARSLIAPRVPLITRIAAAVHGVPPDGLSVDQRVYTRRVTLGWALLLAAITGINLLLALMAVPDGVLARIGITAPIAISAEQWSRWSSLTTYIPLVGFMLLEYRIRRWRFETLPYRDARDFVRRMAALGPGFWRDLFRP